MRTHVLATAAVIAMTPLASADLLINDGYMLDISATAGTGSSTSYLVIDFAATNGISFAFAYQWDGLATTHDMMLALSDIGLGYEWTDWGTGIFADNLTWDGQAGDSSLFWAHSLATPTGNGPSKLVRCVVFDRHHNAERWTHFGLVQRLQRRLLSHHTNASTDRCSGPSINCRACGAWLWTPPPHCLTSPL